MQVAVERCRCHGQALVVEVIARREVDVPSFCNSQVTGKVHRMWELIGITHTVGVDLRSGILLHGHTITYRKAPRQGKLQIAVLIHTAICILVVSLSRFFAVRVYVLHIGVGIFLIIILAVIIRCAKCGSLILFAKQFLEGLVVDCIRKVLGHSLETAEAALIECARMFSSEIEYSDENVDILLDVLFSL